MPDHQPLPEPDLNNRSATPTPTTADRSTVERRAAGGRAMPWSGRTDAVLRWIGWHLAEIVVVGGTAVAGLAANPLWWAVSVPAAAGWVIHERAVRRRARRSARTVLAAPRPQTNQIREHDQDEHDEDEHDEDEHDGDEPGLNGRGVTEPDEPDAEHGDGSHDRFDDREVHRDLA